MLQRWQQCVQRRMPTRGSVEFEVANHKNEQRTMRTELFKGKPPIVKISQMEMMM